MVRSKRAKPSAKDAPMVDGVVDAMEQGRAEIVVRLREIAPGLAGTSECTVYDGFFREWTPAVYVGDKQLFHGHNFRSGLRATVFCRRKFAGTCGAALRRGVIGRVRERSQYVRPHDEAGKVSPKQHRRHGTSYRAGAAQMVDGNVTGSSKLWSQRA